MLLCIVLTETLVCTCVREMEKFRLSVYRKNVLRKKYGFYPIHISRGVVQYLMFPCHFSVPLPISAYTCSPVGTLAALEARVAAAGILPQDCWQYNSAYTYCNVSPGTLQSSVAFIVT